MVNLHEAKRLLTEYPERIFIAAMLLLSLSGCLDNPQSSSVNQVPTGVETPTWDVSGATSSPHIISEAQPDYSTQAAALPTTSQPTPQAVPVPQP